MASIVLALVASYAGFLLLGAIALLPQLAVLSLYPPIAAGVLAGLLARKPSRAAAVAATAAVTGVATFHLYYYALAAKEMSVAWAKLGGGAVLPYIYSVLVAALSGAAVAVLAGKGRAAPTG